MGSLTTAATKATLLALHYSRLAQVLSPWTGGVGIIFMLHRVSAEPAREFEPNGILKITPEFLDETITLVRRAGIEIVSLDEAHRRLTRNETRRRFACFTLDDGYRDNLDEAYPVFARRRAPFTIFVTSDFADGTGDLWWMALEHVIAASDTIDIGDAAATREISCRDVKSKRAAYDTIYQWLRRRPETEARAWVRAKCRAISFDAGAMAAALLMTWDELRRLAADPLVTIGAHTRRHMALGPLSAAEAEAEIVTGVERIEEMLGRCPRHFSFPYGCRSSATARDFEIVRSLGFKTAVTTRKGLLFSEHAAHLHCLPRLSLNGSFQDGRYTASLMTGSPFALMNGLKRMVTA